MHTMRWTQNSMDVTGNRAYVADLFAGLIVLDVSDPAHPLALGNYNPDTPYLKFADSAASLQVVENRAFLVDGAGDLQIVDVSDPSHLVRLGTFDVSPGWANGVQVSGDFACLVGSRPINEDDEIGIFHVLDVSHPEAPTLRGSLEIPTVGSGVAVSGRDAYVAGEDIALTIVDMSIPTNPVIAGQFPASFGSDAIQVLGSYVLLTSEYLGLLVLDVSQPTDPVPVGQYLLTATETGEGWDIQVVRDRVYMVRNHAGLLVFDIRGLPILSIARADNQVVLTWDGAHGLRLQHASSLTNPDWTDVPHSEGANTITLPASENSEFYRLVKPAFGVEQ